MSDAAAQALAAGPRNREEAEQLYIDALWAEAERQRNFAEAKSRRTAEHRTSIRSGLDDLHVLQNQNRTGYVATKAFVNWLATGKPSLGIDNLGQKAAIVLDATGATLVPPDLSLDILNVARRGVFRSLAAVRPSERTKQRASLLSAASVGWGRLEVGTAATDPLTQPESPGQEIEVFDLLAMGVIGQDELDDAVDSAAAAVVDAIGSALQDAEDLAFATGSGVGEPKGLTLAANVTRIPSGNKIAAGASHTPTWAQLSSVPFLLPDRFRDNGTWLLHPASAAKVMALPEATNFEPGPNGRGLMGWPVRLLSALPDPSVAGTTQASIVFADMQSAYRVVTRGQITVKRLSQRFAEQGKVGFIVTSRVGGELLRPSAVALYTQ